MQDSQLFDVDNIVETLGQLLTGTDPVGSIMSVYDSAEDKTLVVAALVFLLVERRAQA